MDKASDITFQRAYNLKVHQKKLKEIHKTPTKRLDNRLPEIFLNKRKKKGYDSLWRDYRVNKENLFLLNRLIEIKSKPRYSSKVETGVVRDERTGDGERLNVSEKGIPQAYKVKAEGNKSVPRRTVKLEPL